MSKQDFLNIQAYLERECARFHAPQEAKWIAEFLNGVPEPEALEKAAAIVARRQRDEPLAYILGEWAFRGLALAVGPGVLIPRPETEGLVDLALDILKKNGRTKIAVADFGAGSGAIGISLAVEARLALDVFLVENSSDVFPYLEENVESYSKSTGSSQLTIVKTSWNDFDLPVDVIVANPPYISKASFGTLDGSVKKFEPCSALVAERDGWACYLEIFTVARKILNPGGVIVFEFGIDQEGQWDKVVPKDFTYFVQKDLSGKSRYLIALTRRA